MLTVVDTGRAGTFTRTRFNGCMICKNSFVSFAIVALGLEVDVVDIDMFGIGRRNKKCEE